MGEGRQGVEEREQMAVGVAAKAIPTRQHRVHHDGQPGEQRDPPQLMA